MLKILFDPRLLGLMKRTESFSGRQRKDGINALGRSVGPSLWPSSSHETLVPCLGEMC